MKKMHWLGIVATSLISMSGLAGCSGDDAPPVNTGGTSGTAGSGTAGTGTAGTGTAGTAGTGTSGSGTGGSGGGGSAVGVQLQSPDYHTLLTGADAMTGAAAPASYENPGGCNSCHGSNGEGNVIGPEIRFTPKDYFTAAVRNGRKNPKGDPSAMFAIPASTLPDTDLDAIYTWLNSLPKPTTGQGLYKAMCGNCHGPNMPTGGSAPINIQGISKAELTQYVRMGNGTDVENRKEYMPKYDTTLLTDEQLNLIGTYIGAK